MTRFDLVQELFDTILTHYKHDLSTPNGRKFTNGNGKLIDTEDFAKLMMKVHPGLQGHRLRGIIDDIHRILRDAGFQLKTHESSQSNTPESYSHSATVTLPDGREILVTVSSTDPDPAIGLALIETKHTDLPVHPIRS